MDKVDNENKEVQSATAVTTGQTVVLDSQESADPIASETVDAAQVDAALDQIAQKVETVSDLIGRTATQESPAQDDTVTIDVPVPQENSSSNQRWRCGETVGRPTYAEYSPLLVAYHERGGKITEEYRALRTNLLAKYCDDRFCLIITSPEAGEGKTITTLNLGMVMAERLDHRTVVVDLNLRDSRMAELLGAKSSPGVADYFRGTVGLEQIVQPTVYPNLFFVTAGKTEWNRIGELLGRSELKQMVEHLKKQFDYVLFDTPPVNRYSDACVAGLAAGQALLVVRMNKTTKEEVEQAVRSLRCANVNVVGMLLTHRKSHLFN